jgi:hypothetical protein
MKEKSDIQKQIDSDILQCKEDILRALKTDADNPHFLSSKAFSDSGENIDDTQEVKEDNRDSVIAELEKQKAQALAKAHAEAELRADLEEQLEKAASNAQREHQQLQTAEIKIQQISLVFPSDHPKNRLQD